MLMLACSYLASAQTTADSVKQAVNNLFEAMRQGDSAMLQSCFAPGAILQTIDPRSGTVKQEEITGFASSIAKAPKQALDERIRFDMLQTDAALASVWTPYQFYYNGKFSHCGVNSFQLVRIKGAWKIQYIIDTRRQDNCL